MLIDLVQLRTFVAVAEEQHLTRAAERLHISQSAASAHVRSVEEYLGTRLFVRTNRSLELTKAGQLMLRQAKTLMNEAAQFTSFARELRGRMEGNLVVGSGSEPDTRIGEIIAALHASHPLLTVDLRMRPSGSARQGLRSGELDVSLLLGRPADSGFTYHELGKVQFRVAGPIAWRERIQNAGWGELGRMPWISPGSSSSAYSAMLDELFAHKGVELNTVARWDNAALGRALLGAGVGLMLVRQEHADQGVREGTLAVSPLVQAEYSMWIAHQASRVDDPLIRAFVEATAVVWPGLKTWQPPA
ncbi:MAG TPA: LysR family transcriptional regulator [Ramlibacter sp.]|nr:LysR family transcriptional regulator [Ramlibacter sp.]